MKKPARARATTVRTRQARGEITRERLLEVALDQFVQHGFHGTSMRQIAQAAGMAVGGIYNHFSSKDAIFAAVLDANHPYRVVEAALQDLSAADLEPFVRETSARVWAAVQGRREQLLPLMFIELVEFQGQHLQAKVEELFPKLLAFVARIDESTENRRPLPGPIVLRSFINFMVGHLIIETVLSRSPLFQQMDVDWLGGTMDVFLYGVLKDEGRRTKGE